MKLTTHATSLIVRPLRKDTLIVAPEDTAGGALSGRGHVTNLAYLEEKGDGYYDGVEKVPIPYEVGDLLAVSPDAMRPFEVGDKLYFRMNFEGVLAKVEGFEPVGLKKVMTMQDLNQ